MGNRGFAGSWWLVSVALYIGGGCVQEPIGPQPGPLLDPSTTSASTAEEESSSKGESSNRDGDCGDVGSAGACPDPDTVRFCDRGELAEYNCTNGESCQLDACGVDGAAECCPTPDPECETLGSVGECQGNMLRFCDGGQVIEFACDGSCNPMYDENGANCDVSAECLEAGGQEGRCLDVNTLVYCDGEDVQMLNCDAAGLECQEKTCAIDGGADCCTPLECETLGFEGMCLGNLLRYCSGGILIEELCDTGCTSCGESGACCN